MKYCCLVASVCFSFLVLAAERAEAEGRTGKAFDRVSGTLWRPYLEWERQNPSWDGNPFDLRADVVFTHAESGRQIKTSMFYDGGACWKFRFTGTGKGLWRFASRSDDPDLDGLHGTVDIEQNPSPAAHGFVIGKGSKWAWQGTGRVFIPQFIMYSVDPDEWDDRDKVDKAVELFFEEHGFNGFHIPSIAANWFGRSRTDKSTNANLANPDPALFRSLEFFIDRVHEHGGCVHVWAWGDHQRRQTPLTLRGGPQEDVDKRLQRYIAARLGPVPGWTMGYGFDLQEWAGRIGAFNHVVPWNRFMQKQMGWRHLLGGRMGPTIKDGSTEHFPQAALNEGLEYYGYEHHRPTYAMYRAAFKASKGHPVFSEDRFRVRVPPRYPKKDYNEERTRRSLYDSAMAGGAANIWGTNVPGGWTAGGGSKPYKHKEWIKTYARFINPRFLADMTPCNELTDGVCLKSPSKECCLFYKTDASSIELDLSGMQGDRSAVAVDAKKAYREIKLGRLKQKKQVWKAPYASDWAVAVGGF